MRATGDGRERDRDGRERRDTSYGEYRSARERFFELLRVDSEIRRLENAWRLPPADPLVDEPAS